MRPARISAMISSIGEMAGEALQARACVGAANHHLGTVVQHQRPAATRVDGHAQHATGARQLVTADCGCMLNITGRAAREDQDAGRASPSLPGEHLATFLLRRTGGETCAPTLPSLAAPQGDTDASRGGPAKRPAAGGRA